jgi:hypothetical protein
MWGAILILLVLLCVSFLIPFWLMWTVKELFTLDWSGHYWAVWSLIAIIGMILRTNVTHKGS